MVPKQLLLLVVALLFSTNVSAHDYKIKKGDTLKELSKRFDITVVELIELNGLEGDRIYIGSTIFIPDSFDSTQRDLQDRQALRRVAGLSTELTDISEAEYRKLRLEKVVLVGVWTQGSSKDAENSMTELAALAETAGSEIGRAHV